VTDRVTGRVIDRVTDRVTGKVTDRVTGRVTGDWVGWSTLVHLFFSVATVDAVVQLQHLQKQ